MTQPIARVAADGAVQNAMQRDGLDPSIMDLDPEKSVARQLDKGKDDGLLWKDDLTYSKYFTMLKMVSRICPYDVAISLLHALMHFVEYLRFIFGSTTGAADGGPFRMLAQHDGLILPLWILIQKNQCSPTRQGKR
ncbi:hypothetical protein ACHAW5_007621 [Stephanodiscus triporus]|uniref:Uncharacterized protein n=1 Tax=Stephanodiscus triporus TaxID=2934178 RepID=A0ABD3N0Y3_9STRA